MCVCVGWGGVCVRACILKKAKKMTFQNILTGCSIAYTCSHFMSHTFDVPGVQDFIGFCL